MLGEFHVAHFEGFHSGEFAQFVEAERHFLVRPFFHARAYRHEEVQIKRVNLRSVCALNWLSNLTTSFPIDLFNPKTRTIIKSDLAFWIPS